MKKFSFILVLLLIFTFGGCNKAIYDETEITPAKCIEIIGMNVDDVDVAEMDYNVYGVRMSLIIAENEENVIDACRLENKLIGPSLEDAVLVKDLYNSICEDYGEPVVGTDFSVMTSEEIYNDFSSPSAYWHIGEDIEMELRYQLFNKNLDKDLEATGTLDIAIIIRSPIEVWA